MGAILKGRDTDLGRDLAIKVLLDAHKNKPQVVQRFIEEAQIGGQLQHPGIAPIYELGQFADKRPFFAMKLVKGETLAKLLADRKEAADERGKFLGIFQQICQTMAYAHSRGVIHREANRWVSKLHEAGIKPQGVNRLENGLWVLNLTGADISNLGALRGMPTGSLNLRKTQVTPLGIKRYAAPIPRAQPYANYRFDFGEAAQQGIAGLQVVRRLCDASTRHGDRHVERGPFVQGRHERHADLGKVVRDQSDPHEAGQRSRPPDGNAVGPMADVEQHHADGGRQEMKELLEERKVTNQRPRNRKVAPLESGDNQAIL